MTTHHLKIWPKYFEDVVSGKKTFELRYNDRNYQVGDRLKLEEFDPVNFYNTPEGRSHWSGRFILVEVTYILNAGSASPLKGYNSIAPYYVIMSIKPVEP